MLRISLCFFTALGVTLSACSDGEKGPPTPPQYVGPASTRVSVVMPTPMPTGTTTGKTPLPAPPAPSGTVASVPPGPSDEDTGGGCEPPVLWSYKDLDDNAKLPDPFTNADGTRIAHADDWTCRRAEISAEAQAYELGQKPPKPATVSAELKDDKLVVTAGDDTTSISFTATIKLPSKGKAPYPVMIGVGGSSLDNNALDALGVASLVFDNDDMAAQMDGSSRGKGKFYDLYGTGHSAGAMMAWAWGVSRLIDALEATPETDLDVDHIGVTGCSRNGKGALVVGAFDERIRLTIPQESGSGGSAAWRVSDFQHAQWVAAGSPTDQEQQTLSEITGENVWFRDTFRQFNDTATRLPFDHHLLLGMVAPRALLVIENTSMYWLGNLSTFTASSVAHRVWDALGVPEAMGFSQVGGHNHCQFPSAEQPVVTAYVKKFLLDADDQDTGAIETDGGFTVDEDRWVDWDVPALD